jgi:hypothetical protein
VGVRPSPPFPGVVVPVLCVEAIEESVAGPYPLIRAASEECELRLCCVVCVVDVCVCVCVCVCVVFRRNLRHCCAFGVEAQFAYNAISRMKMIYNKTGCTGHCHTVVRGLLLILFWSERAIIGQRGLHVRREGGRLAEKSPRQVLLGHATAQRSQVRAPSRSSPGGYPKAPSLPLPRV